MKYEKNERVLVPGANGAQGVIVDGVESVPGYPVYALRWLTPEGETMTGTAGETDIRRFNRSAEELMQEADEARQIDEDIEAVVARRVSDRLAELRRGRRRNAAKAAKRKRK